MIRRLVQALLCVLILGFAGAGAALLVANRKTPSRGASRPPPPLVRVIEVQPRTLQVEIRSQGTVRPSTSSTLVPEVAGRIVEVSGAWADGAFFEEGDVLVKIDPTDYELAAIVARADVARAELRLVQEEQEAEVARREWEDVGTERGEPPPLVVREPQLKEARAVLEAARARSRQAKFDLERTEIRAPYAGRILEKTVDLGQYVSRGTPVARVYAVDYAEVRLPVPDEELAFLDLPLNYRGEADPEAGSRVYLSATFAGRKHTWEGKIVRTEGEIDPRTRMVHVVARVDDPYARREDGRPPLAAGMFVEARILGRSLADIIELDRYMIRDTNRVLVWKLDEELLETLESFWDGLVESRVILRKPDREEMVRHCGRLHSRQVDVIRSRGEEVLVRPAASPSAGTGLLPGEKVCTSILDVIVEEMRVRVDEGSSAAGRTSGKERR
ncbi:MAG: efflux RND transporter periplasmic adaptor subunit [Planctomycetota bacterium]|nr:efflux RND transporter periplasmic adaptor subunit [Planctomycetota bacterium]